MYAHTRNNYISKYMQIQHLRDNNMELVLWRADALSCQTGSLHARMGSIPGSKILDLICYKS